MINWSIDKKNVAHLHKTGQPSSVKEWYFDTSYSLESLKAWRHCPKCIKAGRKGQELHGFTYRSYFKQSNSDTENRSVDVRSCRAEVRELSLLSTDKKALQRSGDSCTMWMTWWHWDLLSKHLQWWILYYMYLTTMPSIFKYLATGTCSLCEKLYMENMDNAIKLL